MKRVVAVLIFALGSVGVPAADLEHLHWLVGTWERESTRGKMIETWRLVSDRTMEGDSWVVDRSSGERRLTETLLLVEMGGEIFYIPRPAENPYPVAFRMTLIENGTVVFENPDHDFPQQIIYAWSDDDTLNVSIQGPDDKPGKTRRIDFPPFTRRKL